MKTLARFCPLIAACLLASCESVTVMTDYDHTAPFGTYKTYALAPGRHDQKLAPSGEAALRDSLRTELAKRGINEAAGGKADLAVVPHVFLQDKLSVQQYTDYGYGYGGYPYRYGYYNSWTGMPPVTYTQVSQYTEGTMILDFVDTRTKKLVFRGKGTAIVEGVGNNGDKISKAVEKIVERLPVGGQ
jgi:hypothetical protein